MDPNNPQPPTNDLPPAPQNDLAATSFAAPTAPIQPAPPAAADATSSFAPNPQVSQALPVEPASPFGAPGIAPQGAAPAPLGSTVPDPTAAPSSVQPSGEMGFTPPTPTPPASGGKKKSIVIALIILVVLAAVGFAATTLTKKDSPSSSTNSTNSTGGDVEKKADSKVTENQVTAKSLTDFSEVCTGNTIANAAAYTGASPHPIAMFEQSIISDDRFSSSSVLLDEQAWRADSKDITKTQLVGCFTIKSSTATGKKCQFKGTSTDTPIEIEQYSAIYTLTIHEAKTGKKLGTKEVSGPVSTCPFLASYNKEDPKLYGDPDEGGAVEAIREFVAP